MLRAQPLVHLRDQLHDIFSDASRHEDASALQFHRGTGFYIVFSRSHAERARHQPGTYLILRVEAQEGPTVSTTQSPLTMSNLPPLEFCAIAEYSVSVDIDAPIEQVWDILTNLPLYPEW